MKDFLNFIDLVLELLNGGLFFFHFFLEAVIGFKSLLDFLVYRIIGNLRHDHSHDHQGQNTQNAGQNAQEGKERYLQIVLLFSPRKIKRKHGSAILFPY